MYRLFYNLQLQLFSQLSTMTSFFSTPDIVSQYSAAAQWFLKLFDILVFQLINCPHGPWMNYSQSQ